MPEVRFPNESDEYRKARSELLEAEKELRGHIERVAEQRRNLPNGGKVKEDYVFEEFVDGKIKKAKLSELFGPKRNSLFIYSFMCIRPT